MGKFAAGCAAALKLLKVWEFWLPAAMVTIVFTRNLDTYLDKREMIDTLSATWRDLGALTTNPLFLAAMIVGSVGLFWRGIRRLERAEAQAVIERHAMDETARAPLIEMMEKQKLDDAALISRILSLLEDARKDSTLLPNLYLQREEQINERDRMAEAKAAAAMAISHCSAVLGRAESGEIGQRQGDRPIKDDTEFAAARLKQALKLAESDSAFQELKTSMENFEISAPLPPMNLDGGVFHPEKNPSFMQSLRDTLAQIDKCYELLERVRMAKVSAESDTTLAIKQELERLKNGQQ